MKICIALAIVGFACSFELLAQPLHNLDFEEYDPATLRLPGWHLFNAIAKQNENAIGLDQRTDNPYASMYTPTLPTGGRFALGLHPFGDFAPWYLSQRGEIPADAKSMSFELSGAQVSFKFDDTELTLEFFYRRDAPRDGWNFADVSAFAGKTVTLEIEATGITGPEIPGGFTGLDNFVFYSTPSPPIPEPRTWVLFALGGLLTFSYCCSAKYQR